MVFWKTGPPGGPRRANSVMGIGPMIRILAVCFLLLAGALGAHAQETRIAAVVNDDVISLGDLQARVNLMLVSSQFQDTPQVRQRIAPQVLRTLIDEKLEMQEAKRFNVAVSEAEIQRTMDRLEQQNNMPKGGLRQFLDARGIPLSTLTSQITAAIAWGKLVDNRLSQSVAVSEEEINEAIARVKANIGKPESRVAEIFLGVDNPSQEEQVRQLAERLIEQIRAGANFPAVAQQFSQSPTAAVGGDLGWVTSGELPGDIDQAVERMQPGQLSPPVRASGGFYLLYLLERRTVGTASPGDAVINLSRVVFPLAPNASDADRRRALAAAEEVSASAKSCGEMAKIGQERAPQLSGEMKDLKVGKLPPEMRNVVQELKVAEASKPLVLHDGVGVFMLCERKDAPPPVPTRDQIADTLVRQRLDTLARRYIHDLRRAAYVDMRV